MPILETLAAQAATQAIGGGMGMLLGKWNDKRQIKQQTKLQDLQIKGSKELTDYDYSKQLQMWKDTNYKAQVDELEKAGLNPALLYGMSGGGGATVGTGGAQVSGANAQQNPGEAQAGMAMGMQLGMNAAQQELIKAQTENIKATTEKLKGPDTAKVETEIGKILQDTKNAEAIEAGIKLENKLKQLQVNYESAVSQDKIEIIREEYRKISGEASSALIKANIDEATRATVEKQIEANYISTGIQQMLMRAETDLKRANIALTKAQITQIAHSIAQKWQEVGQGDERVKIEKFKAEMDANYPGIWNVLGNAAMETIEVLQKGLTGTGTENIKTIK